MRRNNDPRLPCSVCSRNNGPHPVNTPRTDSESRSVGRGDTLRWIRPPQVSRSGALPPQSRRRNSRPRLDSARVPASFRRELTRVILRCPPASSGSPCRSKTHSPVANSFTPIAAGISRQRLSAISIFFPRLPGAGP